MLKKISLKLFIILLFSTKFCLAQVDVVYNDLVWSDEFNTNGTVDNNLWFHQTQLPGGSSWYNNEVQHYTNLPTNSFVQDGLLNIVAKKETYTDQGVTKNYTSARLNSKFAFKYGRVDVRAKIPLDNGVWPAIWLLGKNVNEPGSYFAPTYGTVNWPACGEIDMMEHGIFPSQNINYIQSTLHTPSSYGNPINNGGIIASDLANNYHVYSMNWSPFQITFLLDGVAYYTYNPTTKDANTWPFDKEQFILLNVAMGGIAGSINPNFTQTSMLIDYVRIYQNTTIDNEIPLNFTAKTGEITGNSIELLLNGNDNSGSVVYNVTGATTLNFANPSGNQKSLVINGLAPNTTYTFNISASDMSGNKALNNPIILTVKTASNANTDCYGTSTEASQGNFSTGYTYNFQTIGTDVKFTFELLDADKTGVIAYLWKQTPFKETPMTNVSGKTFTQTITGQTIGSTINYAVKFAYAGGLSVTKYFSYVVGNKCTLGVLDSKEKKITLYPNPVEKFLSIESNSSKNEITLLDISGKLLLKKNIGNSYNLDISSYKSGVYFLQIITPEGTYEHKIIKK